MDKVHTYKQHTITLEAEMMKSGWVGKYSVIPMDHQDTRSHSDATSLKCATEEEAEQIALETAQDWIDNHPIPKIVKRN